jgi:hypothetical protein
MELPTPWGEIEIPAVFTVTYPTENLRKVPDIEAVAKFYEMVFKHFVELMGTGRMHNHERLVFDKQISAGGCLKSAMTTSLKTLSIMEHSITSLSMMVLFAILSIKDIELNITKHRVLLCLVS